MVHWFGAHMRPLIEAVRAVNQGIAVTAVAPALIAFKACASIVAGASGGTAATCSVAQWLQQGVSDQRNWQAVFEPFDQEGRLDLVDELSAPRQSFLAILGPLHCVGGVLPPAPCRERRSVGVQSSMAARLDVVEVTEDIGGGPGPPVPEECEAVDGAHPSLGATVKVLGMWVDQSLAFVEQTSHVAGVLTCVGRAMATSFSGARLWCPLHERAVRRHGAQSGADRGRAAGQRAGWLERGNGAGERGAQHVVAKAFLWAPSRC